jgi:hypothetical protein
MKSLTSKFTVEIEIDASYDVEYYEYGADIDGRRGEKRYDIQNVKIETEPGDIFKQILEQVEAKAEDC